MQLSQEEFRKLGYQAVDIASGYLAELPDRPVFQRMEESERQALMNMPLPVAPLSGEEILRYEPAAPMVGTTGEIEALSLWAGQSVALAKQRQPAAEIVAELVSRL